MKVLIVEDEKQLSDSITSYLKHQQFICDTASDYATALHKIEGFDYDCILLDITLPGGNGLGILKELKANHKTDGVLIISAKDSLADKVDGLQLGADDYLPKPFHLSELGARISAIIRRKKNNGNNLLKFNGLSVDTLARTVFVGSHSLDLTRKEYQLLLYFAYNKGRVVSKNAIAEHLWGDDMESASNHDFLYTHIKNLRRKIIAAGAEDYIQSVYGIGYKFSEP